MFRGFYVSVCAVCLLGCSSHSGGSAQAVPPPTTPGIGFAIPIGDGGDAAFRGALSAGDEGSDRERVWAKQTYKGEARMAVVYREGASDPLTDRGEDTWDGWVKGALVAAPPQVESVVDVHTGLKGGEDYALAVTIEGNNRAAVRAVMAEAVGDRLDGFREALADRGIARAQIWLQDNPEGDDFYVCRFTVAKLSKFDHTYMANYIDSDDMSGFDAWFYETTEYQLNRLVYGSEVPPPNPMVFEHGF